MNSAPTMDGSECDWTQIECCVDPPVYYDVTITGDCADDANSETTSVLEGDTFTVTISATGGDDCFVKKVKVNGEKYVRRANPRASEVVEVVVNEATTIKGFCECPPPIPDYTITSSVEDTTNCAVNPMGDTTVQEGGSQTYNFNAVGDGCTVDTVAVSGTDVTANMVPNPNGGFDYSFTGVSQDETIHITCSCPPPPVFHDLTVTLGGCASNMPEGFDTYEEGTTVSFDIDAPVPPVLGATCTVDMVQINGEDVAAPYEFDVTMTADFTITSVCSCQYPVTLTVEGPCDTDPAPGTEMFDLNDETSFSIAATDTESCRVKSVTVNDIPRSNRNMVRITGINKPFNVHAVCVCDQTCDNAPTWDRTVRYRRRDRVIYRDCLWEATANN